MNRRDLLKMLGLTGFSLAGGGPVATARTIEELPRALGATFVFQQGVLVREIMWAQNASRILLGAHRIVNYVPVEGLVTGYAQKGLPTNFRETFRGVLVEPLGPGDQGWAIIRGFCDVQVPVNDLEQLEGPAKTKAKLRVFEGMADRLARAIKDR